MRKSLLLFLALLLSYSLFAQSRASYIRETFDTEEIPSGWTTTGEGAENWSIWPTHQAGGDPGEIKLYWRPSFVGTSRLVSPAVNLTGIDEIVFSFKGFLDNYMDVPHQIGIATTSDDGTTWNVAWEETFSTSNQGQHSFIQNVNTADMGKENVRFCIFYSGDSNNMNGWYFDDIEVYTLDELNLSMLDINFPSIVGIEANEVGFKVQNTGINNITSFEAQYQIEGKSPVVETFTTDLESTEKADFTFQTPLTLAPGTYNISVTILKVNDSEDVTSDNVKDMTIDAAIGTTQRIPLIEHFSSSTCAPCVYVNQSMNILTENNPGKYAYVKYAMNFPLEGDPYCTAEALERKNYYNVIGAPQIFFDGEDFGAAAISNNDFYAEYNRPAYVDIKGAFEMEGSVINITADVMSLVNIPNIRVFVSINETTTTGNASYNGETEFHHIMMKMLENSEGNDATCNVGEYQRFEFSYDMDTTFVEELDDLEVAVWVQNHDTYEVFNSTFLYDYTSHPYPAQNLQLNGNEEDESIDISWEAPESGEPTGYDLYVNNELVLENTTEMSYHLDNAAGLHTVSVKAVYEDGKTSVGLADFIIIGEEEFPCNAPTNLNATIEQDAEGYDYNFKVTMSWDAADNASQYAVYLDGELLDNTNETSYVKGFDEEGVHHFAVATICPDGESEQSEAFEFELIGVSLDEHENHFEIHPNPAKDVVRLSTDNSQQTTVRIYNVMGMLVGTRLATSETNEIEINVSDYNPGIYFFNIQSEEFNVTKKIIVE